jgi:hypothetical protein
MRAQQAACCASMIGKPGQVRHRSGSVNINAGSTGAAHENV